MLVVDWQGKNFYAFFLRDGKNTLKTTNTKLVNTCPKKQNYDHTNLHNPNKAVEIVHVFVQTPVPFYCFQQVIVHTFACNYLP